MNASRSIEDLLAQLEEYESVLLHGISVLDDQEATEESITRVLSQLGGSELLTRGAGDAGSPAQEQALTERLRSVRLRHGLLLQKATERLGEVDKALQEIREFRKKAHFYSSSGAELGESCDVAG